MTKMFTVSAVNAEAKTTLIGVYADKIDAMKAAKKAARSRRDCEPYGPSSIAYVGREITAVVAW